MPKVKSVAYSNMKRALLDAVRSIPRGKVVETASLAEALNIPPRHVAYILSQMTPDEAEALPWHRVIPRDGDFGRPEGRKQRHERQLALLAEEGLPTDHGRLLRIEAGRRWQPDDKYRNTFWADEDDR